MNRVMLIWLIIAGFLFFPNAAVAQGKGPTPKSSKVSKQIKVELMVVNATTENKQIDPSLRPMMKYFRNYKFTGFTLLDSQNAPLKDKTAKTFSVVGGRKVIISLLSHDVKRAKVQVKVLSAKGKQLLDTKVFINRNGSFIVAGPKNGSGVLFLPISVKY